jgi:O-antigen ligase
MLIKVSVKELKQYFLPALYALFILGFFLFPSSKFHSSFFYLVVAFPFAVLVFMKKVDLRSFFSSRTLLLITIYLVYMFCTLFWADSFGISDFLKYGRRVLYVLIFLCVTIHLTQKYQTFLERLLVLLCWTGAIVAIASIFFYYRQHPFPNTRLFGYGLLNTPFRASSQFGIVVIACTYLIFHQRFVGMKLSYLALLLASFCYILLAQSRSSLLSLAVAMTAWQLFAWLFCKVDKGNYGNKLLIVLAVIAVTTTVLFMVYPGFFDEVFLMGDLPNRLKLWGKILTRVKEAPWFGHGLTADPRTEISPGRILIHPHSVYVGTLFYGGVIGLLFLIAVVISTLWQGFGHIRQPINLVAACMVLYGALCIAPNGNMLIHHPKPFWLFFWFPVALVVASELPDHPLHGAFEKFKSGREKSAPVELS